MNPRLLPWVRLAWVWGVAVLFCIAAVVVLSWQTSGPMGRRGLIEADIERLQKEIQRLERMTEQARAERALVARTGEALERIDGEVFGTLDERQTAVLREVGSAARDIGLLPGGFSYREAVDKQSEGVRFGISFRFDGQYGQIRDLLDRLQTSPQFLIIDQISFDGEEDARSRRLSIRIQVSTFLAETELGRLRELIERTRLDEPADGQDPEEAS